MDKIEVKPLPMQKWHGKKGKESFFMPQKIQAFADPQSMKYVHGLTEKELTELKEKHGLQYDLSDNFNPEKAHPFWDSNIASVKLENRTMLFYRSNPLDLIRVAIMRVCPYVANSFKDWEDGKYPLATHYIHDEAQYVETKASAIEQRNTAVTLSMKLSLDHKIQVIMLMLGKNLRNQSNEAVLVAIEDCINQDVEQFIRLVKKDKKETYLESLVLMGIQKNILRKEGHKIMYMDSHLGADFADVADYLNKPENQDLKILLMEKIEA
jgi:hypothetical protein